MIELIGGLVDSDMVTIRVATSYENTLNQFWLAILDLKDFWLCETSNIPTVDHSQVRCLAKLEKGPLQKLKITWIHFRLYHFLYLKQCSFCSTVEFMFNGDIHKLIYIRKMNMYYVFNEYYSNEKEWKKKDIKNV